MSMLMPFSPGAPREEHFENVAEPTRSGGSSSSTTASSWIRAE
ncbi:hypothetical protein [Streptomyces spectabilis]|nr:hypothetical protein [Streptomyces spectabilis]